MPILQDWPATHRLGIENLIQLKYRIKKNSKLNFLNSNYDYDVMLYKDLYFS